MTVDTDALRDLLCARLCEDVGVVARPDNEIMLRTHFKFPDGDGYPFHLAEAPAGGLRLSDHGHTLMHISYEHDVDSFLSGTRGMLLERIVGESGLLFDEGVFSFETSAERLPEAIFAFGQALTRIYDLTLLSRSNVGSTFYDDLADYLTDFVDESKVEKDYLPEVPERGSLSGRLSDRRQERRPALSLRRAESRQGSFDNDHARVLPSPAVGLRVDHRLPESARDSQDRSGPTLRCRRRHDLVACIDQRPESQALASSRLKRSTTGGSTMARRTRPKKAKQVESFVYDERRTNIPSAEDRSLMEEDDLTPIQVGLQAAQSRPRPSVGLARQG